ncbi:Cysteine protease family C48 [Phytophthora palmivora]|uniref:Cysteine protease family C48 n=1 Tax=Phytophthora palmivora TaxID=4796 RepID=A0A2P4YDU5_9STRA|nr:Cysteine protease family C48 [Phytophthora palmivora]
MAAVEGPDVYHASWEAWLSYFTGYCERTLQVLPVKETMSRVERNKRLLRTKKGADASQLIPQDIEPYQRTYICTHGWQKRKSRSEGSRPRQHIRLTNCPFRFVVQWNVKRKELEVKSGHFVHNHQVSARAFATYPSSRDVDSALVSSRVDGMLAVEMRSKPEFGKISTDDAGQIDACIRKMVYADSSASYQTAHGALKGLCERIGVFGFFYYFEKNWNDCQDRWVMHRRADLSHFSNHTNNRLESFFGKLKDGVDGSMAMSQCIKALVTFDRRVENEYGYRHARIGQFVNSNYDDEMANVLRFTTPYVAGHVEKEYARALDSVDIYNFVRDDQDLHDVHVLGGHKPHQLRDDDWGCTCEFSVSMWLPCRHVIDCLPNDRIGCWRAYSMDADC